MGELREESTLRKKDVTFSNIVGDFLEESFYKGRVENFIRVYDFERQIRGIDVTFNMRGKRYICDEKSAVQYVNRKLNTFALEVSFIDKQNKIHDGWLVDETKINNSFLFVWIDKAKSNFLSKKEDILSCDIALVDKNAILLYLFENGWNKTNLLVKSDKIRKNRNEYKGDVNKDGFKFSYSEQLVEKPINILVKRKKLMEIADFTLEYRNE